jgi:GDSL-like Lipase/Acylhydrolase family
MNVLRLSCAPPLRASVASFGLVLCVGTVGSACSGGGSGSGAPAGLGGTGDRSGGASSSGRQSPLGGPSSSSSSSGGPSSPGDNSGGLSGSSGAGGGGAPVTGGVPGSDGGAGADASAEGAPGTGPSKVDASVLDGAGGNAEGGRGGGAVTDSGTDAGRGASADSATTTSAYNPCPPSGTDCTIMPLGDSITDGFTVRGGYRIPFFQRAHQEGKQFTFVGSQVNGPATVDNVPFPQHHEGHSAHTMYDAPNAPIPRKGIADYVPTVIPQYNPDIVLLMIGTNDVDGMVDLPNAPSRLGMLIDTIVSLDPHALVVVAQITPTMQDPLNQNIQTFNAGIPAVVNARAAAGKHVALVDMYSAFVSDPAYKSTYLADRLHPNGAGYQVMSDVWNTVVHDLLR